MKIITTINPNNVGDTKSSKINEKKYHTDEEFKKRYRVSITQKWYMCLCPIKKVVLCKESLMVSETF